jgi:SRSO17 transposase
MAANSAGRSRDQTFLGTTRRGREVHFGAGYRKIARGELGKQDNCQVAVTLSIANDDASLPVAYRLYLPKDWASDSDSRGLAAAFGADLPASAARYTTTKLAVDRLMWIRGRSGESQNLGGGLPPLQVARHGH